MHGNYWLGLILILIALFLLFGGFSEGAGR